MKTLIVKKPWGQFDQFTHNESTTVKIISLNKGSAISLQSHKNREEFWRILSGSPVLTIGTKKINAIPGDEFMIVKNELHRVEAVDDAVQFLEIAYGDFDENDIERFEDKYDRA